MPRYLITVLTPPFRQETYRLEAGTSAEAEAEMETITSEDRGHVIDIALDTFTPSPTCDKYCGKSFFADWTHTPRCERDAEDAYTELLAAEDAKP